MVSKIDKELGLDKSITRRDFVYGSSLMLATTLVGDDNNSSIEASTMGNYSFDVGKNWYGPGGIGDYAQSHGNTPELIKTAHQIRTGKFNKQNIKTSETGEEFDLVVIGGGFSGLSAAYHFNRLNPTGSVLILDNHPIFGGEAKRNDFIVDGIYM